jgi:nucleotide-binding universal stress UspA family protein
MAFKDLLVHLDDSNACASRVDAAIALAKRQDARVRGIALALKSTISTYVGIDIPSSLTEAQQEIVKKASESALAKFEKAASDAGVGYTGEIVQCSATKAPARLSFYARHADICFVGQPNPDEGGVGFQESLLEGVLFASGRPVYIVPYIGRPNVKIRRAVVAWDGGKKAVRAVNDAIPLLQGRSEAIVLVINPEKRRSAHGDKPGHDIAAHLERHGIKARVDQQTFPDISADTVILNYLADSGADLLIMGAYGHSRLREKAFGGVTNTILHQMTTPVLMSE